MIARFLRGINFTPGEGGRTNHGNAELGPPMHPLVQTSPGRDIRYTRVTVLVHQNGYGGSERVPGLNNPIRRISWDEPNDRLAKWPICEYRIQGNRILGIKEVEDADELLS